MPKRLDEMMLELGVTKSDLQLIGKRRGLRRAIAMHIKSQCRNTRRQPRISVQQIQRAVAKIRDEGENVTQWRMGMALGFGWLRAKSLFRQILWDFPELEEAYEKAKMR